MAENLSYRAEDSVVDIYAADYVQRFREHSKFERCCRECGNYGRSWGCPPFGFDVGERLQRYDRVLLVATKITPEAEGLPVELSRTLIRPERIRLDRRLRELEKEHDALSCSYVGSCLYCPEGSCTRPEGLPCRHPDLVRPSLESYGFDIGKTLAELFGTELLWGTEGRMPQYLTLVCGLFYRSSSKVVWQR